MKRSIMIVLLTAVMLVMMSGCGSGKNEGGHPDALPADESLVVINDCSFRLDKEAEFSGVSYLAVADFQEVRQNIYVQYSYLQQDSSNLLFFRIFYYRNQDFKAAMKDLGLESDIPLSPGKTDNIDYSFYEVPRDDGGTIHFYFIEHDGSSYVLHFASRYDLSNFEPKVVRSIHF
jgi:hypothetical protein